MDRTRLTRWLIPLPAIALSFFSTTAQAEPITGLNAVGYSINAIPPTKSDDLYPTCGSETENNINRNFDYELFQQCSGDMFMVHYTGYITIPENNTIKFMVAADDGGTVKIGLTEFGTWNLKGCSWSAQTSNTFEAGIYPLDGWYFEAGGNGCYMLAWNINNTGWAIVPDSAFTTTAVSTTTTTSTTTTSTTTTSSTTTLPETTTTTSTTSSTTSSTTTLPTESSTTSEPVQTSTTTSTTTTTTSPATTTTTTVLPSPPTQTTSTTDQPVAVPNTSAPATVPAPVSEPEPTTTETTQETTTTTTTLPATTTEPIKVETSVQDTSTTIETAPTTTDLAPTTSEALRDASESTVLSEPETTLPLHQTDDSEASNAILEPAISIETTKTGQISEKVFNQILDDISEAEPAKVVAIIEAVLATNITQSQAVELVVSPVVLEAVSEEQAEQIFETIVPETLTVEQAEQMSEVLSEAPSEIKKAFEKVIDIFGSQFETYIATGSSIPVSQRRSLVAIGGLLTMLPPPPVRTKQ